MQPYLFSSIDPDSIGTTNTLIGRLSSCTECRVAENLNGSYTADFTVSYNEPHKDSLISGAVIAVKANPLDPNQYFEIQKTTRNYIDRTITATAKHIKNRAFGYYTDAEYSETSTLSTTGTPGVVWRDLCDISGGTNWIFNEIIPFDFYSDITDQRTVTIGYNVPESMGNILGGKDGSFLTVFGGEYHFDNFSIELLKSRGSFKSIPLRYGDNLTSLTQTESIETVYTHLLSSALITTSNYGTIRYYGKPRNVSEVIVPFTRPPVAPSRRIYYQDVTDEMKNWNGQQLSWYEQNMDWLQEAIYIAAMGKISDSVKHGGKPVSIEVNVRAELDRLSSVGIGDSVPVIFPNGTATTAKITGGTYDALRERWDSLTVGTAAVDFEDIFLNKGRYLNNAD